MRLIESSSLTPLCAAEMLHTTDHRRSASASQVQRRKTGPKPAAHAHALCNSSKSVPRFPPVAKHVHFQHPKHTLQNGLLASILPAQCRRISAALQTHERPSRSHHVASQPHKVTPCARASEALHRPAELRPAASSPAAPCAATTCAALSTAPPPTPSSRAPPGRSSAPP